MYNRHVHHSHIRIYASYMHVSGSRILDKYIMHMCIIDTCIRIKDHIDMHRGYMHPMHQGYMYRGYMHDGYMYHGYMHHRYMHHGIMHHG